MKLITVCITFIFITLTSCNNKTNAGNVQPTPSIMPSPTVTPTIEPTLPIPTPEPADTLFIKGHINPTHMYPVNIESISNDEQISLAVLQGIVAKSSPTQLFFYTTHDPYYVTNQNDYESHLTSGMLFFKNYLTSIRQPQIKITPNYHLDTWDIINDFKNHLSGYALFNLNDDSQNIATTYCGINNCIPIIKQKESLAIALGLNLLKDFTQNNYTYDYLLSSFTNQINKNFVIELKTNTYISLKDYATMLNGLIYYTNNTNTRNQILDFFNLYNTNPIPVYGWNSDSGDEGLFVNAISTKGNFVVPSDHSINLSFFSSSNTKAQPIKYIAPNINYESHMSYVTFIVSDGDNLQFVTNKANDKRWWGNQNRGNFPIGWTIPPAMFYLEPDVWNYFINSASINDEFIIGASGIGYSFETVTYSNKFPIQIAYLKQFISGSNIHSICIFGYSDEAWENKNSYLSYYSEIDSLKGIFYTQFTPWMEQVFFNTQWINNKPIIPQNEYLDSLSKAYKITNDINTNLNHKNNGFYVVYAKRNDNDDTIDWLKIINDNLDKNHVKVVTPSQLTNLILNINQ